METLQQQFIREIALRRRVLRRVYTAYTLSFFFEPAFAYGLGAALGLGMLWRFTSLSSIATNFLQVPVASVPSYLLGAITTTEWSVLFALVLALVASVQFYRRLRTIRLQEWWQFA